MQKSAHLTIVLALLGGAMIGMDATPAQDANPLASYAMENSMDRSLAKRMVR